MTTNVATERFDSEHRLNRLAPALERDVLERKTADGATADIVILACGRSHRRDDQIGLRVADALNQLELRCTHIIKSESPGPDLLGEWSDARLLIIVDAARADERLPTGAMMRIDLRSDDHALRTLSTHRLLAAAGMSSHLLSIADALALGAELKMLPPDAWVYVVGAADFGYGTELSPEAEHMVDVVARRIRADIHRWHSSEGSNHA